MADLEGQSDLTLISPVVVVGLVLRYSNSWSRATGDPPPRPPAYPKKGLRLSVSLTNRVLFSFIALRLGQGGRGVARCTLMDGENVCMGNKVGVQGI